VASVLVNTHDQELNPVRASNEDIGGQCGSTFDGHGLLASKLEKGDFRSKSTGKGLSVPDETCSGKCEVVTDFEEFLNAFVGDKMPHCGAMVGTNNNTTLEGDTNRTCSGLHDGLLF
jgi:hypothetical protein